MTARHIAGCALVGVLVTAGLLGGGCGSAPQAPQPNAAAEANALAKRLGKLKKGEILIIGEKAVRDSGPYRFAPGGYVFRFKQASRTNQRARLTVSLASQRGSTTKPYRAVVDTQQPAGRATVEVSGRFFVHVVTSSPSYELRFTPRHRAR